MATNSLIVPFRVLKLLDNGFSRWLRKGIGYVPTPKVLNVNTKNVSSTLNIKAGYKIISYINYLVIMT